MTLLTLSQPERMFETWIGLMPQLTRSTGVSITSEGCKLRLRLSSATWSRPLTWLRFGCATGARTLDEWVGLKLRIRFATASRFVAVARRLVDLPVLSARFACGDLSFDQVEAISQMATRETEETLIDEALGLSNHELDRQARHSSPRSRDEERRVWERRRLVRQWNLDESELKFWGRLPAAEGEILDEAIDQRVDHMVPNPETGTFDSFEARSADALVESAATTGDESAPPQVTLHADLDALTTESNGVAELSSGALVPNETVKRLSCDAVIETVIYEENVVIGVGRNTRTIPGRLRRLVYRRAGARCQYPGCGARRWLQVYDKQHWVDGRPDGSRQPGAHLRFPPPVRPRTRLARHRTG